MFIRKTQRRNADGTVSSYLQLAQCVYDKVRKRPRTIILHPFGRADGDLEEKLCRLVKSIQRVLNQSLPVAISPANDLQFDRVFEYGPIFALRHVWNELGISEILQECLNKEGGERPHVPALFAMVANRLVRPTSKRDCFLNWMTSEAYLPEAAQLQLQHLYHGMDFLHRHMEKIERALFARMADLFNADVDLVFFDTTSLYWEVSEEDEVGGKSGDQPLRKRGHNKDGHGGDPQVVVGLALTKDGFPVRSWVWPGNTSDVSTIAQIKDDLRGWRLDKSVIVGDGGMFSAKNLKALGVARGKYILAVPMRKLKHIKELVLSCQGRYHRVADNLGTKEVWLEEDGKKHRYVVCLNPRERKREREHRERLLDKLARELLRINTHGHTKETCKLLASRRFGRYLTQDGVGGLRIDRGKVAAEKKYDGKFVVTSNDGTLSGEEIALGYKSLSLIEGCFRRMKTTGLKTRPIFHWTKRRIIAHIKICVLALLLQRGIEKKCGGTWRAISRSLSGLKVVEYHREGRTILQSTCPLPETRKILTHLGKKTRHEILQIS